MHGHPVEHGVVMLLGFLVGAALAICIAPGDLFLSIAAGLLLGIFAREFFDLNFGGHWFWPFARHAGRRGGVSKSRPGQT